MPRPKRDPSLTTASYRTKNVERAIGFATASIEKECSHTESLEQAAEYYALSTLESAMVYMETVKLIAPQFRDGQGFHPVAVDIIPPAKTAIADYSLAEIEASKAEVKAVIESGKQRRVAAKQ